MDTFYKAVRTNGTDFYTGKVDYASICGTDESLPKLPGGDCCTSRVYHASTSAADTLIGGSWPCRLFLVEGEPVSGKDNKRGFRTLRVLEELPAWQALGPNGEQVVDVIEKAKTITFEQAVALSTARNAILNAAWFTAWNAAMEAAQGTARSAAQDVARYAVWGAAQNAARNASWDAARYAVWGAAMDAARGAVWALIVRDLINEEHFTTLHGPWASVMGGE